MRIIVFGDSICAGSDIHDGTVDDVWVNIIRKETGWDLINVSKGGRPTDSLDEFHDCIKYMNCETAIIISLGANDARVMNSDMAEIAMKNINDMVNVSRGNGVERILLFGPTNINKEALKATYNIRHERESNLLKLNRSYKQYAHNNGITYFSLYGIIPDGTMSVDGVHPDKSGNAIMASSLIKVISDLICMPNQSVKWT